MTDKWYICLKVEYFNGKFDIVHSKVEFIIWMLYLYTNY